jgi:hypothetical protein
MYDELKWTRPYKFVLDSLSALEPPDVYTASNGAQYIRLAPRLARMCDFDSRSSVTGHIVTVDVKGKVKRGIFIEVGASE